MSATNDQPNRAEAVCAICGLRAHHTEDHHVAGRANRPDVIAPVGVPCHETLTALQYDDGIPLEHGLPRSEPSVMASSLLGLAEFVGQMLVSFCECLTERAHELRVMAGSGAILIDVIHHQEHGSPVPDPYPTPNPVRNDRRRAVQRRLGNPGAVTSCANTNGEREAATEAEQARVLVEVISDTFGGLPAEVQPLTGEQPFEVLRDGSATAAARWQAIEDAGLASAVAGRLDAMRPAMARFSAGLRQVRTDEDLVAVVLPAFPLAAQMAQAEKLFEAILTVKSDQEAVEAARQFLAAS